MRKQTQIAYVQTTYLDHNAVDIYWHPAAKRYAGTMRPGDGEIAPAPPRAAFTHASVGDVQKHHWGPDALALIAARARVRYA